MPKWGRFGEDALPELHHLLFEGQHNIILHCLLVKIMTQPKNFQNSNSLNDDECVLY
jgi:hypothetical protein